MSDNLLEFKKRIKPEWYENGPVKTYTREEIDEWERTCDPRVWEKIDMQRGLPESDIKWLDGMKLSQAELIYEEAMEGNREGGIKDGE